jgi:excinuclease UvrABC nuclease subunit
MDANCLSIRGFAGWDLFSATLRDSLLDGLPTAPGVYAILLSAKKACHRGAPDIGYIGRAINQGGLRGRVRQYFHPGPTQSTNIIMRERLSDSTVSLRLGFIVTNTKAEAKQLESALLVEFEAQHGQLPPYNRKRALDLISRLDR